MTSAKIETIQERRKVYLYGPPGSGKSSLGARLAENLGLAFIDLDLEIERDAGRSIPEIFTGQGEAVFREYERAALLQAAQGPSAVIALGGGALLDERNRQATEASGQVLFLDAPVETLLERLAGSSQRPLLYGDLQERIRSLMEARAGHYQSFGLRVATDNSGVEAALHEAQVRLGWFRVSGMGAGYEVHVESGVRQRVGAYLADSGLRGPLVLVTDENIGRYHAAAVLDSLRSAGFQVQLCSIPAGEAHKTMETVSLLWRSFLAAGLERGSTVVALGGGVVGDLAGFAAATYYRGIAWVAVPTSLLAMVDASLGGKTGADLPEGKNLVGAFHPPRLVLADPEVLASLPAEEFRSGMAEVVKHGVIGDARLFEQCARGNFRDNPQALRDLVCRAMAVKVAVIQADPYERGMRAALNLGHTLGHALEAVSGFKIRHGEGVAIGMAAAARLAQRRGMAEAGLEQRIRDVLGGLGLPVEVPADLPRLEILHAMRVDKKKQAGSLRFALPVRIGEVKTGIPVDEDEILREIL